MKVGIGVIGFGWMAYYHFRNIIPKDGDIRITAVYDINLDRVDFARKLGMIGYENLQAFLQDPSFNTVLVATPNHIHKEMAIAALKAGKNVICEKPATLNSCELQEILETARNCNKIFTVHHNRRLDRDYCIVKKAIAEGMVGKPFFIESRVQGANGIPGDWRRTKEAGGGMVYDWGVHLVDQILQITDSPVTEIYAHLMHVKYEVDDNFKVLMKFDDGLSVQLEVMTACFQPLPRWHVLGTEGTLNLYNWQCEGSIVRSTVEELDWSLESVHNYAGPTRTMRPRPGDTIETLELPTVETNWSDFYKNFQAVLEGKEELLIKPEETVRTMKVIDKIFESAETGKSISCRI